MENNDILTDDFANMSFKDISDESGDQKTPKVFS